MCRRRVAPALEGRADIADMNWEDLRQRIKSRQSACNLCAERKRAVPWRWASMPWLFIGEGPGAEEDARGEPFQSDKRCSTPCLRPSISKRGEDVYIANASNAGNARQSRAGSR